MQSVVEHHFYAIGRPPEIMLAQANGSFIQKWTNNVHDQQIRHSAWAVIDRCIFHG